MNAFACRSSVLPRGLVLAGLASGCLHLAILGGLLAHAPLERERAAIGQRRGALQAVTVTEVLQTGRSPPQRSRTKPQAAARHRPLRTAQAQAQSKLAEIEAAEEPELTQPHAQPVRLEAASAVAVTVAPAASATPPAVPAVSALPPGARFASLFAPIIHSPLGRGRWGEPKRQAQIVDPEQARAEAALATRVALQQRMEGLSAAARAAGQRIRCDLQVDPQRRIGVAQCTPESAAAQLWASVQGLLRSHAELFEPATLCLQITEERVLWRACPPASAASAASAGLSR